MRTMSFSWPRPSSMRGVTLNGFMFFLIIGGFCAYVGMKLVPVYVEYYSVRTALKNVHAQQGVEKMSPDKIRQLLDRRFQVSYIESVRREHITFHRDRGYVVRIAYEVRRPLVYNLDFVAKFETEVDLTQAPALRKAHNDDL